MPFLPSQSHYDFDDCYVYHPWKVKIGDLGLARGIDSDEEPAGKGRGDMDG